MIASYRTIFINKLGQVFLITQDTRRKRNAVTGYYELFKIGNRPINIHNAKMFGAKLIVREK